jgi:hypothetical protein
VAHQEAAPDPPERRKDRLDQLVDCLDDECRDSGDRHKDQHEDKLRGDARGGAGFLRRTVDIEGLQKPKPPISNCRPADKADDQPGQIRVLDARGQPRDEADIALSLRVAITGVDADGVRDDFARHVTDQFFDDVGSVAR